MNDKDERIRFSDEFEQIRSLSLADKLSVCRRVLSTLWRAMNDKKNLEKIARLAALRGEHPKETVHYCSTMALSIIPTNLDALDGPSGDDVVTDVLKEHDQFYRITTSDGMTFFDHPGSNKHLQLYWLLRDKAKTFYSPETFFARSAVFRSYVHGVGRVPGDKYAMVPGGVVIEAGSYVGYKALAFARTLGRGGFVGAVEADPDNYDLLRRNIESNKTEAKMEAVHCAVWNKAEKLSLTGKSRMQNTVARTDELNFAETAKIPARTLDDIIDGFGVGHVDFLNLQLNGAEIEAIEGLRRRFQDVRYINIITRYKRDGEYVVDIARRMLEERGCEIVVDYRTERLFNLTARVPQ